MYPDFEKVDELMRKAAGDGRSFLYEHEVYDVLSSIGLGTPPEYQIVKKPDEADAVIGQIDTDRLVLKIIHPHIVHKTDVGGVTIVDKTDAVDAVRRIFAESPRKQIDKFTEHGEIPDEYSGLDGDGLKKKFEADTYGILVYPFVDAPTGFGDELFLGMRGTREFGPIINAGLGGVNTELYASELPKGRAGVTVSPGITSEAGLFEAFKETIAYEAVSGNARGHKRRIEDDKLADSLERWHALVWRYSPLNPDAPYWLTECEINPLLCHDGGLVPVDGLMRFRAAEKPVPPSPCEKIHNLLKPQNICVIGVSGKDMNIGRVILRNLLKGDFTPDKLAIVKPGDDQIDGVKCWPSIADLPQTYDLMVVSVHAKQVPATIKEIIDHGKAQSIILITGGMGEKEGSENLERELEEVIRDARSREDCGPVMIGGNSLGIISRPGGYDTMFVPSSKLPLDPENPLGSNVALVSQSGAFIISRMSKLAGLLPRYAFSTGNQVDLGLADLVEHLNGDPEVRVFGCYAEGLGWLEGLKLTEAAMKITRSGGNSARDVIVYKAGRSEEGRHAASGHTAAIAGDWDVAEAVLSRAGCIITRSFTEWQDMIMLSSAIGDRPVNGLKLAAISNAGFETVGIADNLAGPNRKLVFAEFSKETVGRVAEILGQFRLTELVNIRNPMDITPMAVDRAHVELAKALADDPGVDLVIHCCVPLSPVMKTREPGGPDGEGIADPKGFAKLMIDAVRNEIDEPIAIVLDAGDIYDPMAKMFIESGIPVFRSADDAAKALGTWAAARIRRKSLAEIV